MRNKNLLYIAIGAALCSCSHSGWQVDGNIANAPEGAKVAIEGFNAGNWYNIDSVEVGKGGKFSYVSPKGSAYPDIYRVSMDGRSIYFPVDSLEHITITTDADAFDTDYEVAGWPTAVEMMRLDKLISQTVMRNGVDAALADSVFKHELAVAANDDEHGLLGYYIVNKTIGGKPIFSTADRADLRVLGAIANKFSLLYPNDPRTAYLTARFLRGRIDLNPELAPEQTFEAKEAGLFEINLYDADGVSRSLTEISKQSGPTVLSFTSYELDNSLPYNVELNKVWERYHDQGLNIYQVSIDPDEVEWRAKAKNLPWTAVWYDQKDGGMLVRIYNVAILPTTYIIDRKGDLVDRVDDPTTLLQAVGKHM